MRDATDSGIWLYAGGHGFAVVSKDSDFQQRSLLYGHPPKFIWLRVGNCPTSVITQLLRARYEIVRQFTRARPKASLFSNDKRPNQAARGNAGERRSSARSSRVLWAALHGMPQLCRCRGLRVP